MAVGTPDRGQPLGRALPATGLALLALLLCAPPAAAERRLECAAVSGLVRSFLQNHVRFRQLDPAIEDRAIETYVRRLDPSRTLFLDSEAEEARASLVGIFAKIDAGDCTALEGLKTTLVDHHGRTEQFVREVVSVPDFELDPEVTLIVDPEKRGQPKTPEERDAINRSLIHFQLSNYLAAAPRSTRPRNA